MDRPTLSLPERLVVLFSGFEAQFGWLFFGFGMIFVWVFGVFAPLKQGIVNYDGETTGVISGIAATNSSVNDRTVMRYTFSYEVNGRTYTAESFTEDLLGEALTPVTVEYSTSDPDRARIKGTRTTEFPWMVMFVLIFPVIGLIFMVYSFRRNSKHVDLLNQGVFARGKLLNKERTNVEYNKMPVYKYTFEFTANDGMTYQATGKTHLTHLLEDEETERVIYAPNDPAYATVYDSIPGAPTLGPDGLYNPLPVSRYFSLILPAFMTLLHGTIAYFYFFKF